MTALAITTLSFLQKSNPTIAQILVKFKKELGQDYTPYLNHAKRVYEYALVLLLQKEGKKLGIASAFHDLDIWVSHKLDYLDGSANMARDYIKQKNLDLLPDEIAFIINNHHKFRRIKGNVEAEAFRKADLVDLTSGLIHYNIPISIISETEHRFPRLGFTSLITKKVVRWAITHPFRPFPMLKW